MVGFHVSLFIYTAEVKTGGAERYKCGEDRHQSLPSSVLRSNADSPRGSCRGWENTLENRKWPSISVNLRLPANPSVFVDPSAGTEDKHRIVGLSKCHQM